MPGEWSSASPPAAPGRRPSGGTSSGCRWAPLRHRARCCLSLAGLHRASTVTVDSVSKCHHMPHAGCCDLFGSFVPKNSVCQWDVKFILFKCSGAPYRLNISDVSSLCFSVGVSPLVPGPMTCPGSTGGGGGGLFLRGSHPLAVSFWGGLRSPGEPVIRHMQHVMV